jgi:hypothetical protein
VPDCCGSAVLEDLPAKDWRERMEKRQAHWSRVHGFKMGKKLGDWSKKVHWPRYRCEQSIYRL